MPRSTRFVLLIALAAMFMPAARLNAQKQDDKGLIPPATSDRDHRVTHLRQLLAAADLVNAEKEARKMIASKPQDFEGYFWLGITQLQGGQDYDAVRSLRHAEALDADPYVLKLLAFSYYRLRQFHLFVLMMNAASAKQPDDFAPYYYLGRYYADEVNDFAKAESYFQQAVERNPKHPPAHYYLGYCEETQHHLELAESQYQSSISISEAAGAPYAAPYQGLARLRILVNKPAEALLFATRASEIAPDDPASHEALAKTYAALGRQNDEIGEWEKMAALDPTNASPYYHLYRSYLAMGNEEKAKSAKTQFDQLTARY